MAYEWGRGMDKHYYLHRISHEDYVSYGLLNDGFLTIGWEFFSDKDVLTAAREGDIDKFNKITAGCARSRWSMWYFAKMNVGDTIVVPLYGGKFSAFRVVEVAKSVSELEKEVPNIKVAWGNNILTWKDNRIYDGTDSHCVDIGFFVKVEPIVENVQRSYVGSRFVSRMKIRTTTADITDIKDLCIYIFAFGNNVSGKNLTFFDHFICIENRLICFSPCLFGMMIIYIHFCFRNVFYI